VRIPLPSPYVLQMASGALGIAQGALDDILALATDKVPLFDSVWDLGQTVIRPAIGAWVGGFDVLYACQDLAFDRAHGLRSIPVRSFGPR